MIIRKWKAPTKHGTIKIHKRFLWLPEEIKGDMRWLETITIVEQYHNGRWYVNDIQIKKSNQKIKP